MGRTDTILPLRRALALGQRGRERFDGLVLRSARATSQ